jgi:hypothetical protein
MVSACARQLAAYRGPQQRPRAAVPGAAKPPRRPRALSGQNQAPRNRSEAEVSRSRRVWASGCVSPTGARRDRSRDHPDRAEGGKRGQRSGAGAIQYREGGAVQLGCSPPARRRRAALEADGSDESLLLEETSASNAWPRSRPRTAGRTHALSRTGRPPGSAELSAPWLAPAQLASASPSPRSRPSRASGPTRCCPYRCRAHPVCCGCR